jgi:putative flavoprotein involved in K+ transport
LDERHDTVIVGGGQAGLAMSYHLRQRGREHVILEKRRVAERWRTERWDSLRFQLPNRWLELPGKPYAGNEPDGFVHHSEVLRFVLDYAAEIAAPVRTGVEVTSLGRGEEPGWYSLETTDGRIAARQVVIATGPFQRPLVGTVRRDSGLGPSDRCRALPKPHAAAAGGGARRGQRQFRLPDRG